MIPEKGNKPYVMTAKYMNMLLVKVSEQTKDLRRVTEEIRNFHILKFGNLYSNQIVHQKFRKTGQK
jgi:hypothetical protein